jgi:hypothetical protein
VLVDRQVQVDLLGLDLEARDDLGLAQRPPAHAALGQQRLRHPDALGRRPARAGPGRVLVVGVQEANGAEPSLGAGRPGGVAIGHAQRPDAPEPRPRGPRERMAVELLARVERQPPPHLDASLHRQKGAA